MIDEFGYIDKYDRWNDGDHVSDNEEEYDDDDDNHTSKTQWSSDLYKCLESVCIKI